MFDVVADLRNGSGSDTLDAPDEPGNSGRGSEGAAEDLSDDDSPELSLDATFEVLRNRRRQLVLSYIRDCDETVTIGELAEHIAAIENDTTVRQLNAQQRKRVYIGLYQSHLPKMADLEVIEFNQSRGHVSKGDRIEPLYDYLDVANGRTTEETDTELHPFHGLSGGLFALFGVSFLIAQLSGAYLIATGCVLLLSACTVLSVR